MNFKRQTIFLRSLLLLAAILLLHNTTLAQGIRNNNLNNTTPIGKNPIPDYEKMNQKDSDTTATKPPKKRKPLESYYFSDTLRQERIFAWTVSMGYNSIKRQIVDTLLHDFNIDYLFMRKDVGSVYLGNVGSASIPINYFNRPNPYNFAFLKSWDPFIIRPEKALFYNSKTPYSRLSYGMSGAKQIEENIFDIILSHNISPSSTFNINFKSDGTKGQYQRQKTSATSFAFNFAHTGKRYAIHAGYINNSGEIHENGGILDDRDVTDTVHSRMRDIRVNLNDAKNTYKGNTFWLTQSYGIPLRKQKEDELTIQQIPTIYIGMSLEQTKFSKRYEDLNPGTYYPSHHISTEKSDDYMSQWLRDIKAFAQLQPYNRDGILGLITGGIGYEDSQYYLDRTLKNTKPEFRTDRHTTYIYGSAEGAFRKYLRWEASMKYNFLGYRSNDLSIDGNIQANAYIKDKPITLDASIRFSLQEPDFWVQKYLSNHYEWTNSFGKESSTTINARLLVPSIRLEAGANYQIVQNKIYYNSTSMPAQLGESMSIMGIYLQKDFRFGGFHLNHRVLMQWSTNQEVIPVPAVSAFLTYMYEFAVVKNVLQLQLGLDARYTTKYYAFAYNPAIATYYNQREKELGNYPYVDFFAAAKWKRMRILVKLQHFNANMFGDRNYFLALHQPANRMMLKFGVSWSFYD